MAKSEVKLVEFNMKQTKKEEAEEILAGLIDEGFVLMGQHEAEGWMNFTMVRADNSLNIVYNNDGGLTPAHQFQVVNGAVERIVH
uniref:DNA ligase n=1 Tax=Salmonella phage vB_SEnST11_KE23 TaxID=3161174 RepID=A0AAU8GHP4_9CAUD